MTKKLLFTAFCLLAVVAVSAHPDSDEPKGDDRPHFSPQEFWQKEVEFITDAADLTQAEANTFFPLYRQMKDHQRRLSFKNGKMMRDAWRKKLSNAESLALLKAMAKNEEDIVKLEEKYQKGFLKIISASKLLKVKIAEKMFERRALSDIAHGPKQRGPGK